MKEPSIRQHEVEDYEHRLEYAIASALNEGNSPDVSNPEQVVRMMAKAAVAVLEGAVAANEE